MEKYAVEVDFIAHFAQPPVLLVHGFAVYPGIRHVGADFALHVADDVFFEGDVFGVFQRRVGFVFDKAALAVGVEAKQGVQGLGGEVFR